MPSTIDLIGHNAALQEHWIRRVFAFLIDAVVSFAIFLLVAIPLNALRWMWWLVILLYGLVWFGYSLSLETAMGGTIGKKLLSLRVVALDGNLDVVHGFVRNLTKVFPVAFFFVDLPVGAFLHGDPRQRLFDHVARTTVTRVDDGAYMEEQFRMMQHAPPHPMTPRGVYPQATPSTAAPPAPAAAGRSGNWPGQTPPPPSGWPQHEWDEQGRLMREKKFCTACGGQLVARGDGKLTCVRCGAVY